MPATPPDNSRLKGFAMTATALDRNTALILIDLQKGIVALPLFSPAADVIPQANKLAAAFRQHDLPVVLVNVAGGAPGRNQLPPPGKPPADWAELVPELDRHAGDHYVTKRTWGAFTNTDLAQHLKTHGVTQVVIAGIATSIGVESTARQAHELGFNVSLAIDAMTDLNGDAHANSIARVFPRLGETGTTDEIIALLDRRN
jgi:nicotinamidase-related amidase